MAKKEITKAERYKVLEHIVEILNSTTLAPAEAMIAEGKALIAIGEALMDLNVPDARAVIKAVREVA